MMLDHINSFTFTFGWTRFTGTGCFAVEKEQV